MVNETLARRYATAVFGLASDSGAAPRVGDDLAAIERSIEADAGSHEFFVSPVVDRKQKERALEAAFGPKAHPVALHTLLLLVRKRRESLLHALIAEYRKLELASRGEEPLAITSAKELPKAELDAMVARLEQIYNKKFNVSVRLDPKLIGGVRIMMGDRRVDGSVAGRLEDLARTLFATN